MALRRSTLEDSIRLHQFSHDATEELRWVLERRPTAHSTTLGDSLTSVQSLIKKHQVRQEMGGGESGYRSRVEQIMMNVYY